MTQESVSSSGVSVRPYQRRDAVQDPLSVSVSPCRSTSGGRNVWRIGTEAEAGRIAVGDNDEVGGKNKTDFYLASTVTGATVRVDDTTIVKNGAIAL